MGEESNGNGESWALIKKWIWVKELGNGLSEEKKDQMVEFSIKKKWWNLKCQSSQSYKRGKKEIIKLSKDRIIEYMRT